MLAGELHEAIVELFRNRPRLALELLEYAAPSLVPASDGDLAEFTESVDLGDAKPLERSADFVVRFQGANRAFRIIVEVQLKLDAEKRLSWPGYVAVSWARTGCRTFLVVVVTDQVVARWAARPIDVGHFVLAPIVVGPDSIPLIVDAQQARRSPELAVLAVGVHANHPDAGRASIAAAEAVGTLDEVRAFFYTELLRAWLPEAARAILEAHMDIKRDFLSDYTRGKLEQQREQGRAEGRTEGRAEGRTEGRAEGRTEGRAEGRTEGRAEGRAEAILRVLSARGVVLGDATAARIRSCTDVARLDAWLERSLRVNTAEELFD